jgi:hypothetical protein
MKKDQSELPLGVIREDGKLVYVARGRSGRAYKRPMRQKSSKSKLKVLAKAQRPWRP